jgi:glycine dehydrogenase subunit 2
MTTILEEEPATAQKSPTQPLIFEHSKPGRRGYQLPDLDVPEQPLEALLPASLRRDEIANEVEVSEVDVIRHFTRLSKLNVSIDAGLYPLGSCTMAQPRINEEIARTPAPRTRIRCGRASGAGKSRFA